MTWIVREAGDADATAWDRIASSSADAWLGHAWWWNARVEEGVWGSPRRSLVATRDGKILGIAPLHLRRRRVGPFTRSYLYSNFWTSGGFAFDPRVASDDRSAGEAALLATIRRIAVRDRIAKLIVRTPVLSDRSLGSEPGAANPLLRHGLADLSAKSIVLDLEGMTATDVWDGMDGRARTAIRKAERSGITVTPLEGDAAVDRYYPLHLSTYRRTGAPPLPEAYFRTVLSSGAFTGFFAHLEGRTIGAAIIASYAGRALYSSGASLPDALTLGTNNLLQWRAIQWSIERRMSAYELGEIPSPPHTDKIAGIVRFKTSFGGRMAPAFMAQAVYATTSEQLLALIRRMRTRAE